MLDTNIPSELLKPRPNPLVIAWVRRQQPENLFISVVTMGERAGVWRFLTEQSSRRAELERLVDETLPSWFAGRILPVTRSIAERWGMLDAGRQLAGRLLNLADGLIAATACDHDLASVTRNVRDFAEFDLAIFNPWVAARLELRLPLGKLAST